MGAVSVSCANGGGKDGSAVSAESNDQGGSGEFGTVGPVRVTAAATPTPSEGTDSFELEEVGAAAASARRRRPRGGSSREKKEEAARWAPDDGGGAIE
jgi:hypothetical protein